MLHHCPPTAATRLTAARRWYVLGYTCAGTHKSGKCVHIRSGGLFVCNLSKFRFCLGIKSSGESCCKVHKLTLSKAYPAQ